MTDVATTVTALQALTVNITGGDVKMMGLADMYAEAYRDDPAATVGLLCVSQQVLLLHIGRLVDVINKLEPVAEKAVGLMADPQAALANVPEPWRTVIVSMLNKQG